MALLYDSTHTGFQNTYDSDAGAGGVPLGFVHDESVKQDQQASLETHPLVTQNLCEV